MNAVWYFGKRQHILKYSINLSNLLQFLLYVIHDVQDETEYRNIFIALLIALLNNKPNNKDNSVRTIDV